MWLLNTRIVLIFAQITLITGLDPQQYALANALQNILSPANTEKALQIIQMAANRQLNNAPCVEEKTSTAQPNRRIIPIGALQRMATPNQQYVKQTHSQLNVPQNVELISNVLPIQNSPAPQNVEVISNVLPLQNSATIMSKFTMPNQPMTRESQAPLTKEVCPYASQGLVNPFLPAASPISALSPPTSNLLPSAFPMQSRGHFLRKIPIPPPTL